MIPVRIDTLDLSSEFNLDRGAIDDLLEYTVDEITKEFLRVWENTAKKDLFKSRDQYINSLRVDKKGRFTGVAYLDPVTWLANAVEVGAPPFDMKPGMVSSPKAKTGKKGQKYMSIPFRFATPGAIGNSTAFAGVMPAVIQSAVQKSESKGSRQGAVLSDIPEQYQMPKSHALRNRLRSTGFTQLKRNTAMTSKYEGLKRSAIGSGYVNFRVVSENSDPDAFLHPGVKAHNLAEKALGRYESMIPTVVDRSIDNFLVSLGF